MIDKPHVHTNYELTKDYERRQTTAINRLASDEFFSQMLATILTGSTLNSTTNTVSVPSTAVTRPYRTITSSQTATSADMNGVIFADTSGGTINLTFPAATGIGGNYFTVVKTSAANTLTITNMVNGIAGVSITAIGSLDIVSDNTNYFIG